MKKTLTSLILVGMATIMSAADMPKCNDSIVAKTYSELIAIARQNETSIKHFGEYRALDLKTAVETKKGYSKEHSMDYRICRMKQVFKDATTHKIKKPDRDVFALITKKDSGEIEIQYQY